MDWQSIETAPDDRDAPIWDRVAVLVCHRETGQQWVGVRVDDKTWQIATGPGTMTFNVSEPTHWMPLPAPPT